MPLGEDDGETYAENLYRCKMKKPAHKLRIKLGT